MTEKVRRVSTHVAGQAYSPEEINELLIELRTIDEDPEIAYYDLPNIQEMKEIIEKAEDYSGTWYHSKVVLSGFEEDLEKQELKNKISELGEDRGIALSWTYDKEDDVDLILEAMKNQLKHNR